MKLANKDALVTGGATGIGRATAELFAQEGARVHIIDYNEAEGRAAVEQVEAAGGQAHFYATDVRSEESVAASVAQIRVRTAQLDVAVFAAGVLTGAYKTIEELSEEDWDATLDTNLKGTFLSAKYATPLLAAADKSVLLIIASGAGVRGGSSSYAYAASKAGQHGLHYKLEGELGPKGVRLHVICPGGIATPLKLENIAQAAEAAGRDPEEAKRNAVLGDPMGVARGLGIFGFRGRVLRAGDGVHSVALGAFPTAGVHARSFAGHVRGLIAAVVIPVARVAVGKERADFVGQGLEVFLAIGADLVNRPGPSGSIGDGQHFARIGADVGEVAVKDAVVDEYGRTGLAGNHDFFGVGFVARIGVGVGVQAQVRARHYAERRDFWYEVVEIVKHRINTGQEPSKPKILEP